MRTPWLLLALLLATNLPLWVCLPLPTDAVLYDLQGDVIRRGGLLYRDAFEPNLPGIVWWQYAVRFLSGRTSIALRLADGLWFAGTVALLSAWRPRGLPHEGAARFNGWAALALAACYLSLSEWNHVQRDTVMLLPAAAALAVRCRAMQHAWAHEAGAAPGHPSRTGAAFLAWGLAEGLLWGAAFWIKPFVAVPGLGVWLISWRQGPNRGRTAAALGVLAGGMLAGAAGSAWLIATGAWPYLWETIREWNPEYAAARLASWNRDRIIGLLYRNSPWILLHVVAVPTACRALWARRGESSEAPSCDALRAAFYLGWLGQALLLQHNFDYVHAPTMLLAVAWLASRSGRAPERVSSVRWAWAAFALLAAFGSPLLRVDRLAVWPDCFRYGSRDDVRARLTLFAQVDWRDLGRTRAFLAAKNLKPGELTCFNSTLVYLYADLDLPPSTRYGFLDSVLAFCPKHREAVAAALEASPQQYVVTDLIEAGLTAEQVAAAPAGKLPLEYPRLRGVYPWSHPPVFRAGRYVVHRAQTPPGRVLWRLPPPAARTSG